MKPVMNSEILGTIYRQVVVNSPPRGTKPYIATVLLGSWHVFLERELKSLRVQGKRGEVQL